MESNPLESQNKQTPVVDPATDVKVPKTENTAPEKTGSEEEQNVDFSNLALSVRRYWWVYILSIIICVGLGLTYLKIKSPVYLSKAMVMMNQNDEDDGGAMANSALGALMTSFSLGNTSVNIEDEIYRMTAHSMLKQVVQDLDLNTLYWSRDSYMVPKKSYFGNSPLQITMPEAVLDTLSVETLFLISVPQTGTPVHINVEQDGKNILDTEVKKMPCVVNTPYGSFSLSFTQNYKPGMAINLKASVKGYEETIDDLMEAMAVNQSSRKANAVTLDIEDMDKERGKAILNHLIAVYNQQGIDDKNQQTLMSAKFIEDRLVKMYRELNNSEAEIESYKKRNNVISPEVEADYTFKLKGGIEEKSMELEAKSALLKMLRDYLANPQNKYSLAPFAQDVPDVPIEKYNELVLEYMRLSSALKAGTDNAQYHALTAQIDAMRSSIIATLDKNIQGLNMAVDDMNHQLSLSESRLNESPTFERELRELYRDQEIKNRIYGFLLQKREENELKLSKNVPKAMIIDEAYTEIKPVKPKKGVIIGGAFVAALAMGFVVSTMLIKRSNKKREQKANKAAKKETKANKKKLFGLKK